MQPIKTLYVFYADYTGHPVFIQLMDTKKYDEFKGWQPNDPRIHKATIHSDSTREDDPIITIVAVTEHNPLGQENAERIDQDVINWLIENGHIRAR